MPPACDSAWRQLCVDFGVEFEDGDLEASGKPIDDAKSRGGPTGSGHVRMPKRPFRRATKWSCGAGSATCAAAAVRNGAAVRRHTGELVDRKLMREFIAFRSSRWHPHEPGIGARAGRAGMPLWQRISLEEDSLGEVARLRQVLETFFRISRGSTDTTAVPSREPWHDGYAELLMFAKDTKLLENSISAQTCSTFLASRHTMCTVPRTMKASRPEFVEVLVALRARYHDQAEPIMVLQWTTLAEEAFTCNVWRSYLSSIIPYACRSDADRHCLSTNSRRKQSSVAM